MLHTIHNEFLSVTVAEQGAELQSILGADGTEYLWQGDPTYWSDRACNIFPYVGRLTKGSCYLDGQLCHMDIHGIALYCRFDVVSNDGTELVMELNDDEKTYAAYPRHFAFRIIYRLSENTLDVIYEVENTDDRMLYFGIGGHPGFNVPLAKGKNFEDYRLRFSHPCHPSKIGFTEECFLSGKDTPFPLEEERILSLRHDLFDNDAIVLKETAHEVTLETEGDSHSVTVRFPQMDYVGFWHRPKTDAPYLCIEPWCSLPSKQDQIAVLEEQEDLISLEPKGIYRNHWQIIIE